MIARQLSDAEKLRKVIVELVETERTYVKVKINLNEDDIGIDLD